MIMEEHVFIGVTKILLFQTKFSFLSCFYIVSDTIVFRSLLNRAMTYDSTKFLVFFQVITVHICVFTEAFFFNLER